MTRWIRARFHLLALAATAVCAAGLLIASGSNTNAGGTTIFVSLIDDLPVDGCNIAGCTLREAIISANSGSGIDTITLASGTYKLNIFGQDEDDAARGDLDIDTSLTIRGNGPTHTTIDAKDLDRVFDVGPDSQGINVTLRDMTIRNGFLLPTGDGAIIRNDAAPVPLNLTAGLILDNVVIRDGQADEGGGILNTGDLTLIDSTVTGNQATFGGGITNVGLLQLHHSDVYSNQSSQSGGGIRNNDGTVNLFDSEVTNNETQNFGGGVDNRDNLNITRSLISDNESTGGTGGGIFNDDLLNIVDSTIHMNTAAGTGGGIRNDGDLDINRTTIDHNHADNDGGGIFNSTTGVMGLLNSTISGNETMFNGGGFFNDDSHVVLTHVTIAENVADVDGDNTGVGGGILTDGGNVDVLLTLIGDNIDNGTSPDCSGPLDLHGFNFIENTSGCGLNNNLESSYFGYDPHIGHLGPHGGYNLTHPLLFDSLAIDSESADCPPPFEDQRGFTRPIDGNGNGIATCDIGAFEFGAPVPTASPIETEPPAPTPTPGPGTPTPTPGPTATATPVPTPTPTPEPVHVVQGDTRCDGKVDTTDQLAVLRFIVSFPPLSQDEPCPDVGSEFAGYPFGDVRCDGTLDSVDALAIARFIAGLPPINVLPACVPIGQPL